MVTGVSDGRAVGEGLQEISKQQGPEHFDPSGQGRSFSFYSK